MSDDQVRGRGLTVQDKLLAAITAAGLDPAGGFAPDALGALDHFHTGGRPATLELLQLVADLIEKARVLDIGAGIGGPARLMSSTLDCRVVCLEPSSEYCGASRWLNRLTSQDGRIDVHHGGAPPAPFPDASFDVVWMQNVGMCVVDKPALYREVRRVLRPGGRFVFQEVVACAAGEPYFPVPWADEPSGSFLVSGNELHHLIGAAGFADEVFEDFSEAELGRPPAGERQGPLTLAAWVDNMATKSRNTRRSLEDGRIRMIKGAAVAV